ncbi:Alkylmercury lyase [Modestobacter sp. DSM 44400]|nr:Alkylmercury lyase [Modestobacter sp. DSM 44400]
MGSSGQGRLTETCCPVINLLTTSDHALAYQRKHGLDGFVLTLSEAVEAGTLAFGDLLHPSAPTT